MDRTHSPSAPTRARTLRNFTVNETTGRDTARRSLTEAQIIDAAKRLIARRVIRQGPLLTSPQTTRDYFVLILGTREQEVFCCAFLDNRHRVIAVEELFYGTIDGSSVHPREVVRRSLYHNAAAMICAHNHPSGIPEPSQADRHITRRLKDPSADRCARVGPYRDRRLKRSELRRAWAVVGLKEPAAQFSRRWRRL